MTFLSASGSWIRGRGGWQRAALAFAAGAASALGFAPVEFFPALLQGSPARLTPMPMNTSGDIRLGMQANMLALHPADSGDLEAGDAVLCYPI